MSKKTHYILTGLVLGLCLPGYLIAGTKLKEHTSQTIPFEQRDSYNYPAPAIIRALSLNYTTFASSAAWISALLYYGEWRISRSKNPPKHLERHARSARDLDRDFIGIYEWFNAVYITAHHTESRAITFDDLESLRLFNNEGMAIHPDLWRLPYITGMNYIGYSYEREPDERLLEIEHSIHYLKQCTQFTHCPDTIPFTVAYLYRLKQELSDGQANAKEDVEAQLELYSTLYAQTMDPGLRSRLAQKLEELGLPKSELDALDLNRITQFKQAYESTQSYLPLDLWTQVVYPTPEALSLIQVNDEE